MVLSVDKAKVYLDTLRRYCVFSGFTDTYNYAGDVIYNVDHEWRTQWAEVPPYDTDDKPTRTNNLIMNQVDGKDSKHTFMTKVRAERDRVMANNGNGSWNNASDDNKMTPKNKKKIKNNSSYN